MAAALIRVNQIGHPTQVIGTPGISRDDIVGSTQVQLSNSDDTGVRSHRWELLARPGGSAAVLSSPTSAAVTFTPDLPGTYRIRLRVNEGRKGEVDTRLVAVRDSQGFRIPAAGEEAEANWGGNAFGWQPDMELLLQSISNVNTLFTLKSAVRLATDAALPAHSFNSTLGTLTASANGALTVDGVAVVLNDRVVVKDEGGGTSVENGLYRVSQVGTAGTPWILIRSEDADTDERVKAGLFTISTEGSANADKAWFITTDDPITVNTTAITFDEFPLTIADWAQVLAAGNTSGGGGTNNPTLAAGDALASAAGTDLTLSPATGQVVVVGNIQAVDSGVAPGAPLVVRAGDYSGVGTDNAGAKISRGGNTTSADSSSDAGPWTGGGGNANGGRAGPFFLGGAIGALALASTIFGSETTANNPAGTLEVAAGDASGGGVPAILTLRGGEPKTVNTNNRPAGAIVGRGGDGGGQGLAGPHDGGPATWRGGDGVDSGAGADNTIRGGNSGGGTNADAGKQFILGGSSTGNRVGGFINNVGGAAAGSADGGSWTWVPGTSGSGNIGTMVVGSAAVDFIGNALNVTGQSGRALFYDNATNANNKAANIGTPHFTNAEEPFFFLAPRTTTSTNVLNVGGGVSTGNAATLLNFVTAANNTTIIGTTRGAVFGTGAWVIGSGTETFTGNALNITGNTGRILAYDVATDAADKSFRLACGHFTNSEGGFTALFAQATAGANTLTMGGGTGTFRATTVINFNTAANTTTATGTLRMRIDNAGVVSMFDKVLIGGITVGGTNALAIGGASGRVLISSVNTDATPKASQLMNAHFTNAEEPFTMVRGATASGTNTVTLGGGASDGNAATLINFSTAANSTTLSGTIRMFINSAGLVTMNGDLTLDSASPNATFGDGTGGPINTFNKAAGSSAEVRFSSAGALDWNMLVFSDERFIISRHIAGVFQDNALEISNSTGDITIANDVTIAGRVITDGAAASDANTDLDAGIFGDTSGTGAARGITVVTDNTGSGTFAVGSPADNDRGQLRYDVGQVRWEVIVEGAQEWNLDASAQYPQTQGGLTSGRSGNGWASMYLQDGVTAPGTPSGGAVLYVDTADGDLKVKFSDGFVAVIAADS